LAQSEAEDHPGDSVVELTDQLEAGFMYINGPGGCGKTFLMNTIIHYLSASNILVITVASSSVAGLMLVNGMTADSRFKISLDVSSSTQCNWDH
jgi:chromosomal replication initiation ATPase DnaA